MAPRTTKDKDKEESSNSDDLKTLVLALKESVDNLTKIFDSLDETLKKVKEENLQSQKIIRNLADMVNDREQHSRNSSIRISGLKISDDTSKDAISTSRLVYDNLLNPILSLAVKDKMIPKVPDMFELIEYAHTLPVRRKDPNKPTQQNPVIVRFQSRLLRQLVFKYKKSYLDVQDRKHIFISEDLTSLNYKKLVELKNDSNILAAWSLAGKIYFTEKKDPEMRKRL